MASQSTLPELAIVGGKRYTTTKKKKKKTHSDSFIYSAFPNMNTARVYKPYRRAYQIGMLGYLPPERPFPAAFI